MELKKFSLFFLEEETNGKVTRNNAKKLITKNDSNNIMPSQIQVTCWREDLPGTAAPSHHHATSSKSTAANSRLAKNAAQNKAADVASAASARKSKGDGSIAERIVNAARAASTKKN